MRGCRTERKFRDQGGVFAPAVGLVWAVLLCLILWCNSAQAARLTVPLAQEAVVDGEQIFFHDLVAGDMSLPDAFMEECSGIVIGRSPLPGQERSVDRRYVEIRLKQHGFDPEKIVLEGAEEVRITRSAEEIPPDQVEKIALDYVFSNVPWDRNRIHVKSVRQSRQVLLPKGKVTYEVEASRNEDFMGSVPLSILFKVDGGYERKVWVTVDLEVLGDVVVTRRALRRHQIIEEGDLEIRRMDLASLARNTVTRMETAVGQRLRRTLGANSVLRTDHIEMPYLVKPGDVVTIVAETRGLRVTGLGRVRERGREGETVRVSNIDSDKEIYGEVMDSNTVQVQF